MNNEFDDFDIQVQCEEFYSDDNYYTISRSLDIDYSETKEN